MAGRPVRWSPSRFIWRRAYLKPGENSLEVEVTNLSANRIRDLELRKVDWKIMKDANIISVSYQKFDPHPVAARTVRVAGPGETAAGKAVFSAAIGVRKTTPTDPRILYVGALGQPLHCMWERWGSRCTAAPCRCGRTTAAPTY